MSTLQEGAEQAEFLGAGGCDAPDRAVQPRCGGVGAHPTEAAPGRAAEAQEAGLRLLTGATYSGVLSPCSEGASQPAESPHRGDKCGIRVPG